MALTKTNTPDQEEEKLPPESSGDILDKQTPGENPGVSDLNPPEDKKQSKGKSRKAKEEKPVEALRESDEFIVLEHPTVKGSANVALYLGEEEKKFELIEGKISFKNDPKNYPLRDKLLAEGWGDHTYYALEIPTPVIVKSDPQIKLWTFQHPNHSRNFCFNFTLGIYVDGREEKIEVIDSLIKTDNLPLAFALEREKWNLIGTELEEVEEG